MQIKSQLIFTKMDVNIDYSSRLKDLRKVLGFNQTTFSNAIGISQNHLSGIENGHHSLNVSILQNLIDNYNVNVNWLLSGIGSMFNEDDNEINLKDIILRLQEYEKMNEGK